MKHRYTVEQVQKAAAESFSLAQVLTKLGIIPAGGNYQTINKFIRKHNIDITHLTGQIWNKGRKFSPHRKIEEYLVLDCPYHIGSHKLKLRLLQEGVFEHKCYQCLLAKWNDEKIPLELEHINGNHKDDRLENLTLLCPNCHAQTETYRGKNKKKILPPVVKSQTLPP